jgi:hypothetical protein
VTNWQLPNVSCFSENKNLDGFPYQKAALKNIIKVLHLSFETLQNGNTCPDKQTLHKNIKNTDLKTNLLTYLNL